MFLKSNDIAPQNLPEKIVWFLAIGTYPLYLIGSLYIIVPVLGTFFTVYGLWRWRVQDSQTPIQERIFVSPTAWIWLVAGLIIELAMIVAHFNFDLGLKLMLFTTVNNWFRRWAIIPMFIFAGHFYIRPKLMYRAACITALEAAVAMILGTILALVGVPQVEYFSPLSIFGGGESHYRILLFQNAFTDRIYSFTPWVTAAGTLGSFFFFLAKEEKSATWRIMGMTSALLMILTSQSRAALVCIPFVSVAVWLVKNIVHPRIQLLSSGACFLLGIFSTQIINVISFAQEKFATFRGRDSIYSSRTRSTIYRMTLKRWWNEAPIWGHGRIPEKGPPVVGGMPIGTHHTWFGGLYTFGLFGFLALAIAVSFTLFSLAIQTRTSNTAKVGLALFLVLFVSTFTDNVEYISYVYWFSLLFVGVALRQHQQQIELSK